MDLAFSQGAKDLFFLKVNELTSAFLQDCLEAPVDRILNGRTAPPFHTLTACAIPSQSLESKLYHAPIQCDGACYYYSIVNAFFSFEPQLPTFFTLLLQPATSPATTMNREENHQ